MVRKLDKAWYIILYHDVSWEENHYIQSIGGTCPPDYFRAHVKELSNQGELVSIEKGKQYLESEAMDGPKFSFWFDDGLTGVERYAVPILDKYDITGAISINSRFVKREEFFWRFKLSYLNSIDAMRFLRERLQKYGFTLEEDVRGWTMYHFSRDIVKEIDELYRRFTTPAQRQDAFRLFLDGSSIRDLKRKGWTIANHTSAHYSIGSESGSDLFREMFVESEEYIKQLLGTGTDYWVIPFGVSMSHSQYITMADQFRKDRDLVFVGDRPNTKDRYDESRVLYRIAAPVDTSKELIHELSRMS